MVNFNNSVMWGFQHIQVKACRAQKAGGWPQEVT